MSQVSNFAKQAFQFQLREFGEDFHAGGETRKGIYSNKDGAMKITFPPEEFPLGAGDVIKRWATEEDFKVLFVKPIAVAGVRISFQAIVQIKA